MDYTVKETNIWIVTDCKSEEEAKQRVTYQKRIGLANRIIEVIDNKISDRIKVGKWVAFEQDGMDCVLHGKIIRDYTFHFLVKCKNAQERCVELDKVIGFYDSKDECYSVK